MILQNLFLLNLNCILAILQVIKKDKADSNLIEEKTSILQKNIEMIELGLSEAQVCCCTEAHIIIIMFYITDRKFFIYRT